MKKMKKLFCWLSLVLVMAVGVSALVPDISTMSSVDAATIKISKTALTLTRAQKYTLKVTGTKSKVTWKSSNTKVATVSSGTVKARTEGSATITATVGKKKLTCKVTVKGNYKTLYKALLEKSSITVNDKKSNGYFVIQPKSFLLLDIDKNGVPELIIKDMVASDGIASGRFVFTVKGNKTYFCGYYYQKAEANLWYSSKYKAINCYWWVNGVGGMGYELLRVSGTNLTNYRYIYSGAKSYGSSKMIYKYGTSGKTAKNVSKSTHNAKYKQYFKTYTKYKFINNTVTNRKKKLG